MDIHVLKRLDKCYHVCRMISSGVYKDHSYGFSRIISTFRKSIKIRPRPKIISSFSFLVMTMVGTDLTDLRRLLPDHKMKTQDVLRIGLQMVNVRRATVVLNR